MSQAGRTGQGGPAPADAVLKVETADTAQASPNGAGIVYYLPRPNTALTTANIVTTGDGANTFFAAVTDAIYLPATDQLGLSGVYGIEGETIIHTRGPAGVSSNNIGAGAQALNLFINNGTDNSAFGGQSLRNIVDGSDNLSAGSESAQYLTDGSRNTILGSKALNTPGAIGGFNGNNNISIGYNSSNAMDNGASDNIVIGNLGGAGINNATIIGQNTLPGHNQTTCFIHGIAGVEIGNEIVTIDTTTGQLGSTPLVPTGLQSFTTPAGGPVTPTVGGGVIDITNGPNISVIAPTRLPTSTFEIGVTPNITLHQTNAAGTQGVYLYDANRFLHVGSAVTNDSSVYLGINAGNYATPATHNVCIGGNSGQNLSVVGTGIDNTCVGFNTGNALTTGYRNTCIGSLSGRFIIDGHNTIAIGYDAGVGGAHQNNNIWIGNYIGSNNSNNIKIGDNSHTHCTIQAILNAPTVAGTRQVVIEPSGNICSIPILPGAGRPCWLAYLTADTGYIWLTLPIQLVGAGNPGIGIGPVTTTFSPGCTIVNGSPGTPTSFTAITTGLYNFTFRTCWYTSYRTLVSTKFRIRLYMYHLPAIATYVFNTFTEIANKVDGRADNEFIQPIYLTAGQSVTFGVEVVVPPIAALWGLTSSTTISGFLIS